MNLFSKYKNLGKKQKYFLWAGIFFIFYTLFGFFILPQILHKIAVDKFSSALGRSVSIQKIKFNPYSLYLNVQNFNIKEKKSDATFFSFDNLFINIQINSIFNLGPVIKEIKIDGLFLNTIRYKNQKYNFSDLINQPSNKESHINEKDNRQSKTLNFAVSNIILKNGKVIIHDQVKNKTHTFSKMEIGIPFISNSDTDMDIFVTPHFSVNFNGSPLAIKAKTKPFIKSKTTQMSLDFKNIDLKTYYDYIPLKTNMQLKHGSMDMSLSIGFSQVKDQKSLPEIFLSGTLGIYNLKIIDLKDNPVFKIDKFNISLDRSDILKGDINFNDISLISPNISLLLNNSDQLNIYRLFSAPSKKDSVKPEEKAMEFAINCKKFSIKNALVTLNDLKGKQDIFSLQNFVVKDAQADTKTRLINIKNISSTNANCNVFRIRDNRINFQALAPSKSKGQTNLGSDQKDSDSWNIQISDMQIKKYSLLAKDIISKDKGLILIDNINLHTKMLSTLPKEKTKTDLSFNLNKKGNVDIAGEIEINPLKADLSLKVNKINLNEFQPFVDQYLNLVLSSGDFSSSGQITIKSLDKNQLKANYQGSLDIKNFLLVDNKRLKPVLKLKAIGIKGMDISLSPVAAKIQTIKIIKPLANIKTDSKGVINLTKIVKTSKSKKSPSSPVAIRINKMIIENGQVRFNDKSVKPNFKTKLTKINVKVLGLDSKEKIKSDINMDMIVNNHTPIKIKGKINPLKKDLFCDMDVKCSNMDLGYLTPYSGKFAGYKIQKGKLSLNLKYFIDKQKIDSKNNIFLDQFEFGEKVKSKDAINAPMNLAVSLLKDPMGKITLDLPVKGDLNDPQFSVGGIIVKMIINLLTKAATAPFSLLGAMFGGGEDLNIIAFDPGAFNITPLASKKVETLIKALTQRPGLNLEITGYVNLNKDKTALIDKKFNLVLKEEKLKSLIKQGSKDVDINHIILSESDEDYEIYLKSVFEKIESKALENNDSEITPNQIIKAIKATIQVNEDELRELARARALTIKDAILNDKGIDPGRIFIVEAKTLEPGISKNPGQKNKTKAIESGKVIMALK